MFLYSVMNAWKTAMVTMDKLVVGIGHSVREGSVLLGLASWHLYPDMIVLGTSSTEIKQHDSLVSPGGVTTIGLQGLHQESTKGVYWSLPLAYVRYCGDPIQVEGSISSDSSRVSLDQFLQVMLGALCTSVNTSGELSFPSFGCSGSFLNMSRVMRHPNTPLYPKYFRK